MARNRRSPLMIKLVTSVVFSALFIFYLVALNNLYPTIFGERNLVFLEMKKEAHRVVSNLNYEANAKKLASQFQSRNKNKGILFCTFLKWENKTLSTLVKNMAHTDSFGDWLVIVYNSNNFSLDEMYEQLFEMLERVEFNKDKRNWIGSHTTILLAPDQKEAINSFQAMYESYILQTFGRKSLRNQWFYKFQEELRPRNLEPRLYSKASLFMMILNYLPKYHYVWTLDSDIDLSELDLSRFFTILFCSFANPPLVSQPLIAEPSQRYRYLLQSSWKSSKAISSAVGFIEIQAPIFDSSFLQYFILAFIRPLLPAMIVLGADWGIDELFCSAAKEFALHLPQRKFRGGPVCMIPLDNLSVHHRNGEEINHAIGLHWKRRVNSILIQLTRNLFPHFAHHGRQYFVNPFKLGTFYPRKYRLTNNLCSYKNTLQLS